ncbi:acid protease [Lentinus brumalis]|uniref:Acid protease n=1 Tax=Lentinus brumalis TaxID=2498619 RepID=A0A371DYC5_9APHY|nr:acid protease [Polyporus brumalis]
MQLALSFSTLLASILVLLSATDNVVQAVPLAKRGKSITLPLTRIHQNRGDVHPQILLQQHINRSQRRIARMKGVAPPSKRDLEANLSKRMFIPQGGRPGKAKQQKRYNRLGMPGAQAAVADDEDEEDDPSLESLVKDKLKGLKTAAKKGKKGKGNGNANAGAANGTDTGAAAAGLAIANTPTTANSLGLDIEAQDVGYIATIQMGTPATDFKILMDSGSADLWVGSETCVSEAGGDCGNHQFLGPNGSSSFTNTNKQFEVTYGTGHVSGDIVTDDISIAGLALTGHTFGVANTESADFSDDSVPFDGLMGLAQSTLSNQGVPTPVEALASAGLIDEAITSYKISRLSDNKNDGEITFGALDDTKFDPKTLVTFDNVATNGFWEGAMDAVTADGKDLGLTGRSAILDTGTTLIVAPPADAAAVHAAIPGAQSDGNGGFVIPCDTTTSVALSFGGASFAIDPKDLIFAAADNTGTNCVSGISSGQIVDDTTWLVGDVFLKNAYFSTDVTKNTISLAQLV